MNETTKTLTPGQFLQFLGIDRQRLRVWTEKGLFGEAARQVGRGRARAFTLEDAIAGRLALEVMDLTKSRKISVARHDWRTIFRHAAAPSGMVGSADGVPVPWGSLLIFWADDDYHAQVFAGGPADSWGRSQELAKFRGVPAPTSVIAVDLLKIIDEAREFFAHAKE